MPKGHHHHFRSDPDPDPDRHTYNYNADAQWASKNILPTGLLLHDVRLETLRADRGPLLEIHERSASTLVPVSAARTPSENSIRVSRATTNAIDRQNFTALEEQYGWIRHLRLRDHQRSVTDGEDSAQCRWIHCSSKYPDYLRGFLWALSDDLSTVADALRVMDMVTQRQTRYSKHGKYFAPFSQTLRSSAAKGSDAIYPFLISVPSLDWTVQGPTPPLRFQIDRREGFLSTRSSAHVLRSILQHFYRLEDTHDREGAQVFAKHKPWSTDRELDLKTRQWYGRYPTGLNVDEVWILAVDPEHVVTFSSNQTWKSRWPPFQLSSRISDVSFRNIRNSFFRSEETKEYTAITHTTVCLSGAVGMLHRNFWPDLHLCMTDRYAGYLGHLQYRLHRAPSTQLVMDLIACQEELNIVIGITEQQLETIGELQSMSEAVVPPPPVETLESPPSPSKRKPRSLNDSGDMNTYDPARHLGSRRSTYRQLSSSALADPIAQLIDNLERELADLRDLRDNTDRLVNRTIQLVNIRLEDHGKAILVFTVVTIVFLPLNFVSSFFGMNFVDIRNMEKTQWLFWAVALCVTVSVVAASLFLAFSGGPILEKFHLWKDLKREGRRDPPSRLLPRHAGNTGFRVFGTDRNG
jgi:hypothetical protein